MRKEQELDVESRFPTSTYKHCPPKPLNRKHTHHHAQDSQEFLRRTLDVLHDELALDLPPNQDEQASSDESASGAGGAKDNSSTDDEEGGGRRKKAEGETGKGEDKRRKGTARRQTSIVLDIFAGRVISEVKCSACGKVGLSVCLSVCLSITCIACCKGGWSSG